MEAGSIYHPGKLKNVREWVKPGLAQPPQCFATLCNTSGKFSYASTIMMCAMGLPGQKARRGAREAQTASICYGWNTPSTGLPVPAYQPH